MNLTLQKNLFGLSFVLLAKIGLAQCVSISCPGDITVSADPAACGAIVTYTTPIGTNSCPLTGSETFNYTTDALQTFTVPSGVTSIHIITTGAQGGSITTSCVASGGLGAKMEGDFAVTPGEVLSILVGQQGFSNGSDAGGGGGTFVVRTGNVLLVAAGGGGGATNNIGQCGSNLGGINASILTAGTANANGVVLGGDNGNGGGASGGSGGGGGGFLTDGTPGAGLANNNGKSYQNGGIGGTGNNNDFGGYGGGGAGWFTGGNGGGGGGYSGGGTSGSQPFSGGGGGGSYSIGTNQLNAAGFQSGNGQVLITYNTFGSAITTQLQGLASGDTFPIGTTTVEYQVSDGATDIQTCSFTVEVTDDEFPVITCPSNISVANNEGECGGTVTFNDAVATDNCTISSTLMTAGLASGAQFPIGITTVEFTAIDASMNISTCEFTVEVLDEDGPVVQCPASFNQCDSIVSGIDATTSDCSGLVQMEYELTGATVESGNGDANGIEFNTGTTTVTYTFYDISNNISSCAFDVTIDATTILSLTASADTVCVNYGVVQLSGTPTGGTWSGAGVTGSTFNPTTAGAGTHTLNYNFMNQAGCASSASLDLVVNACLGLTDKQSLTGVLVHPNPTSGNVSVSFDEVKSSVNYSLIQIDGSVISSNSISSTNKVTVSLENLAAGIYLLNITADGQSNTIRLVRN